MFHGERAEEFRHFRPAHAQRVALVVEEDKAANPPDVCLLGPPAEVPLAHRRADAVEEAWRGTGSAIEGENRRAQKCAARVSREIRHNRFRRS
jgi:hypothetical protein